MKTTHIITLIDAAKPDFGQEYRQEHIVKSCAVRCLEHAHKMARGWMFETTNVHYQVFISEVIETHYRESAVKVSKHLTEGESK
jgi:hypothetical protein